MKHSETSQETDTVGTRPKSKHVRDTGNTVSKLSRGHESCLQTSHRWNEEHLPGPHHDASLLCQCAFSRDVNETLSHDNTETIPIIFATTTATTTTTTTTTTKNVRRLTGHSFN